jgi:hypothetical protein
MYVQYGENDAETTSYENFQEEPETRLERFRREVWTVEEQCGQAAHIDGCGGPAQAAQVLAGRSP